MLDITPELLTVFANNNITVIPKAQTDSETTEIPCISYYVQENFDVAVGTNCGYSEIRYCFEIWDRDYARLNQNWKSIDAILKEYTFERISSIEQQFNGLIRKIITYRKLLKENYEE